LFGADFAWADDYYAASIGQSQVEVVRNYLKNQADHHRNKTFEEECQMFMVKYGFIRVLG
jgi:putative transposase